MQSLIKEAQKALGEMDPEEKKVLDSLGIKMPTFKNVPKITDQQLATAWEDDNRIVPKRNATRIAAIPKAVSDDKMQSYITAVQNKITAAM